MELHEVKNKLNTLQKLIRFKKDVETHKKVTLKLIKDIQFKNKNIYGYGASARSSTFLNYCEFNEKKY